jgi:PadR family transcriptional regulator PadR
MPRKRMGPATLEVLQAIAGGRQYGFDIMDATELPGGTVYPALAALERDALVDSDWEDPAVARTEKRPPRRYYAITAKGRGKLGKEVARLRRLAGLLDDNGLDEAAAASTPEISPHEA